MRPATDRDTGKEEIRRMQNFAGHNLQLVPKRNLFSHKDTKTQRHKDTKTQRHEEMQGGSGIVLLR